MVNIKDWCKNTFEIINQPRVNTYSSYHQYDSIILINGIPVVHIELKKQDINYRRAIQQIMNYKNDESNGYLNTLMCFVQVFVVSNGGMTQYFANNNNKHLQFDTDEKFLPIYKFADENHKHIVDLKDFTTKHFFAKCKLAEMISHYMILIQTEQKILMMRPYQIYAVKNIVKKIEEYRGNGDNKNNGYIWHTTGSGKTLTSFKASTLLGE